MLAAPVGVIANRPSATSVAHTTPVAGAIVKPRGCVSAELPVRYTPANGSKGELNPGSPAYQLIPASVAEPDVALPPYARYTPPTPPSAAEKVP